MRKCLFVSLLRRTSRMILLCSMRCWRQIAGRLSPPLHAKVPVRHFLRPFTPHTTQLPFYQQLLFSLQHLNVPHEPRQRYRQLVSWTMTSRPSYSMTLSRLSMVTAPRLLVDGCVHTAPLKTRTAEMTAKCADCHCDDRKRISYKKGNTARFVKEFHSVL
jgi:hypothetical protein